MKYILIYSLFFSNSMLACVDKAKKIELFKIELKDFIDSAKYYSVKDGKYNVYVASFYHLDTNRDNLCFTLGYIFNYPSLKEIKAYKYFKFEDEIILIKLSDSGILKELKSISLLDIDSNNIVFISNKLADGDSVLITGTSRGRVGCIIDNKVQKLYFSRSDDIPIELSIYGSPPVNISIELFYDPIQGPKNR